MALIGAVTGTTSISWKLGISLLFLENRLLGISFTFFWKPFIGASLLVTTSWKPLIGASLLLFLGNRLLGHLFYYFLETVYWASLLLRHEGSVGRERDEVSGGHGFGSRQYDRLRQKWNTNIIITDIKSIGSQSLIPRLPL